jgi:hypothetical protein
VAPRIDPSRGYTEVGILASYATVRRCLTIVEPRTRGVRVPPCEHAPRVLSHLAEPNRAHRRCLCRMRVVSNAESRIR